MKILKKLTLKVDTEGNNFLHVVQHVRKEKNSKTNFFSLKKKHANSVIFTSIIFFAGSNKIFFSEFFL